MDTNNSYMLLFLVLVCLLKSFNICEADPTDGFTPVALTQANFELQRPYNVPLEERYSYENGIHKLWVYADDKPHDPNSHTQPRNCVLCINVPRSEKTQMIISMFTLQGLDYSSGVWQFEGYGFVPNGTSGVTISQIHGASSGATTLILRIYDGSMRYYSGDLVDNAKWFRLNVIHDVDGGKATVYIDGVQKYSTQDKGPGDLYFKCGVYAEPAHISYYMESRWRDIKIYKKSK